MKKVIGFLRVENNDIKELKMQEKKIKDYCLKRNYVIEKFYENDIEELFNDIRGKKIIICDLSVLSNDIKKIYDYVTWCEDYCCSYFETIKSGLNYKFDIKLLEGVNPNE